MPPNTPSVKATPVNAARTVWSAPLVMPADKKGVVEISVRYLNGAGMAAFATASVEVTDRETVRPARITGRVHEGTRPQAGLEVLLAAAGPKATEKAKTTTGEDGKFSFEEVVPGEYTVSVSKPVSGRKAVKKVVLKPGETINLDLALFLE
jgi:hypothetical protein